MEKQKEYELQSLQPYPPAIIKQLRPNMLTKNNTNQPMRWKGIAYSKDLKALKKHLRKDRRIVDLDNLQVIAKG